MAGKTAILAVKIVGDATGATQAMVDTEKAAGGLGAKLGGFGKIAAAGAVAVGAAAITAGKALFDVGAQWDDVADTIRVGTGLSGDALESAFESAKNVAGQIPAALEDIGPAIADVNTRMGLTGTQLETVASQYLEAGRILGESVDVGKTSAAFNLFKIQGEDVSSAMDDLFRVSQATGMGMNELSDVVTKAGPALTNLGFSFADSAALAGSLDKAGIDANAALGGMQKGLVTLAKAGEEPQAAFKRVVGEIEGFVAAGDTAAALDMASTVFGTRGAAQFVGAVQSGALGLEDMMAAAGTTEDTILGLGQETADAAEKWQLLKNKAMVALEPLAGAIFDGVGAALDWLLNLFNTTDLTPFTGAIGAVAGAFESFWPTIQTVIGFVQQLTPIFQTVFDAILGLVGPALDMIKGIFGAATAAISGDWSGAWTAIQGVATAAVELVLGFVDGAMATLQSIISSLGLDTLFTDVWNAATGAVSAGIESVMGFVTELPGRILGALSGLVASMYNVGRDTINGLIQGVKDMAGRAVSAVRGVIDDAIGGAKRLLGIASPSKVFASIGMDTGAGLVQGLKGQTRAVAKASTAMVAAAIPSRAPQIELDATRRSAAAAASRPAKLEVNFNGLVSDRVGVAREIVDALRALGVLEGEPVTL